MVYTMLICDWMGQTNKQTNKLFAFLAGILADITLFQKREYQSFIRNRNDDKRQNRKTRFWLAEFLTNESLAGESDLRLEILNLDYPLVKLFMETSLVVIN